MMRIKKNDIVFVISGKDKGKKGTVLAIDYKANKVQVQGIAIVTRHVKPRRQGEQGGIRQEEGFIALSKVMPICPSTQKPCRVNIKELADGKKTRVSHRSKETI